MIALVNTKARVGVFSIALGAYPPQIPSLAPEFEAQYEVFKKTLPDTVENVDGGIATMKELAQAGDDKFRASIPRRRTSWTPLMSRAAVSDRHIDTILKVVKIFNMPVDIVTR